MRFTHPAQQVVLQDYIHAVTDAEARIERLTTQIIGLMPGWSLAPVVEAIQAMRGPRQGSQTNGDTLPRPSLSP